LLCSAVFSLPFFYYFRCLRAFRRGITLGLSRFSVCNGPSAITRSFLQQLKAKNIFMIALLQNLQLAFLESAGQPVLLSEIPSGMCAKLPHRGSKQQ